jgi:hypothetical protein
MSLRDFISELDDSESLGMDTTSAVSKLQPGFVSMLRNGDLPPYGPGAIKRKGYVSQMASPWEDFSILAGLEFRPSEDTNRLVLFGANQSEGRLAVIENGTVTQELSTGMVTTRPSLFQFRNLCFFYNETSNPFLYDGGVVRQIGVDKPASAPVKDSETTGDLVVDANYLFAYTYRNSQTGAESSPSPISEQLATASGGMVITVVPGDSDTADELVLYRSVADGNILFEEKSVALSSTSVTSDVKDSALLTRQLELDNTRIVDLASAPKNAILAQNRVFLQVSANSIRYSKIGQSGPMPESFEVKALIEAQERIGPADKIVGLATVGDTPLVLKERSIGRLEAIGIPGFNFAEDPIQYEYRKIPGAATCIGHFAGAEVEQEYVWLGRDNVYATNGLQVRDVGDPIVSLIRQLGLGTDNARRISAVNHTAKQQIWFSVFSSTAVDQPDTILVGDYKRYPQFKWSLYTPGEDKETHPGYQAGCFFEIQNTATGSLNVFFGNTNNNGQYYRTEQGESDNGFPIWFELKTRPYSLGNPGLVKLLNRVKIWAKADTEANGLQFATSYDLQETEEFATEFNLPIVGGTWANDAETLGDYWDEEDDTVLPTSAIFHANFEDLSFDAGFAAGSNVASIGGTVLPVVQGLDASQQVFIANSGSGSAFSWSAIDNIGAAAGSARFFVTFGYSGSPSGNDRQIFYHYGTYSLKLTHETSGDLVLFLDNSAGSNSFTIPAFAPNALEQYEFLLGWDHVAGELYFFINRILQNAGLPYTFAPGTRTVDGDFGFGQGDLAGISDLFVDNVTMYSDILHTEDYSDEPAEFFPSQEIPEGQQALVWGGDSTGELEYYPHRKAKYVQLTFRQTADNATLSMFQWELQGSAFGAK